MADTLPNVFLPRNQWVDLYAETGLPVGTEIQVQNIGAGDVYLTVRATQPPVDYDAYNVAQRRNDVWLKNTSGDSGAWAFSPNTNGKINVRPV